jgi:hypothetical protein
MGDPCWLWPTQTLFETSAKTVHLTEQWVQMSPDSRARHIEAGCFGLPYGRKR